MDEKTKGQELSEKLSYTKKSVYETADENRRQEIFDYAKGYMAFLDAAKTEREAVRRGIAMAEEAGFTRLAIRSSPATAVTITIAVKTCFCSAWVTRISRRTASVSLRRTSTRPAST